MNSETADGLADRLRRAADLVGGPDALSRMSGVPRRSLASYLSGEHDPKAATAVKLADTAGVSIEWLLTGRGEPPNAAVAAVRALQRPERELVGRVIDALGEAVDGPRQLPVRVPEAVRGEPRVVALSDDPGDTFVFVPRYEVQASAGAGALAHSESIVDHLAFKEQWLRRTLGVSPAEVFLLEASGDSMVPTIQHGDLLLIWRAIDYLRDNGIYCLRIWDSIVVKRLRRRAADGAIIVISDNPLYPDEELGQDLAEHVAIIGQVLWHGGIV